MYFTSLGARFFGFSINIPEVYSRTQLHPEKWFDPFGSCFYSLLARARVVLSLGKIILHR